MTSKTDDTKQERGLLYAPWRVKNAGKNGGVRVFDCDNVLVVETPTAQAQDYEIARLIAAAPDLLAALEQIARGDTELPGVMLSGNECTQIARAALAKSGAK